MLRSLKDLERYTVAATDGEVSPVVDFLFEDTTWGQTWAVSKAAINLEYETRPYDYDGRPKRWEAPRLGPPLHVCAAIPGTR